MLANLVSENPVRPQELDSSRRAAAAAAVSASGHPDDADAPFGCVAHAALMLAHSALQRPQRVCGSRQTIHCIVHGMQPLLQACMRCCLMHNGPVNPLAHGALACLLAQGHLLRPCLHAPLLRTPNLRCCSSPRGANAVFELFPARRDTEHLDGIVLRFYCAWDNTAAVFGEVRNGVPHGVGSGLRWRSNC